MKTSKKHPVRLRRGLLSMELVFTLPILMVVLFGLFEFSLLFMARGRVVESSRAGARHASLPGSTPQSVRQKVRQTLSPRLRERAEVQIERGPQTGDAVSVTVIVPMRSASPDLLWPIGYRLQNRYLISTTRMCRE
ncbi:MAG: hypothetical protein Tsb009_33940 [Planctomycetaceae bacterium]